MLLGNQSKTKYYVVENLTSIWMASSNGRWHIFLNHNDSVGIATYASKEECQKALNSFVNAYHNVAVYVMPEQKVHSTDIIDGSNII